MEGVRSAHVIVVRNSRIVANEDMFFIKILTLVLTVQQETFDKD